MDLVGIDVLAADVLGAGMATTGVVAPGVLVVVVLAAAEVTGDRLTVGFIAPTDATGVEAAARVVEGADASLAEPELDEFDELDELEPHATDPEPTMAMSKTRRSLMKRRGCNALRCRSRRVKP